MKKVYLVLLMCCCLCGASAQQMLEEVVYTKNGSVVRGIITETKPGKSVKIETADGNVFVFDMKDVEKITKEPAFGQAHRSPYDRPSPGPSGRFPGHCMKGVKGYRGFAEAGVAVGIGDYNLHRMELNTSHGYQFNPYLFVGAGVGMHYYFDASDALMPIFADCRVNFLPGRIAPAFDFKLGYSLAFSDGVYGAGLFLAPSAGVRIGLNNPSQAIRVNVGFSMQQLEVYYLGYSHYYTDRKICNSVLFKIGYEF